MGSRGTQVKLLKEKYITSLTRYTLRSRSSSPYRFHRGNTRNAEEDTEIDRRTETSKIRMANHWTETGQETEESHRTVKRGRRKRQCSPESSKNAAEN